MHVVNTREVVGWMNDVTHQYIQSVFWKMAKKLEIKLDFHILTMFFFRLPVKGYGLFDPGND